MVGPVPEAEHAFVLGYAGEPVGFLARLGSLPSRCPDRTAVNGFSGFGAHEREDAQCRAGQASR